MRRSIDANEQARAQREGRASAAYLRAFGVLFLVTFAVLLAGYAALTAVGARRGQVSRIGPG